MQLLVGCGSVGGLIIFVVAAVRCALQLRTSSYLSENKEVPRNSSVLVQLGHQAWLHRGLHRGMVAQYKPERVYDTEHS